MGGSQRRRGHRPGRAEAPRADPRRRTRGAGRGDGALVTLSPGDADYPSRLRHRLRDAAPAVLHVAGDPSILSTTSIGVVGSRVIGAATAELAQRVGRTIAHHGHTLVSGGSPGVDEQAMGAALDAGGRVVGVLADSLVDRLEDAVTRRYVETGRLVLCTPFAPEGGYTVERAHARNKLIFALSEVTLVVACDKDVDSTWAGATEALHNGFGPVAVWRGAGEGSANAELEALGAIAVTDVEQFVGNA